MAGRYAMKKIGFTKKNAVLSAKEVARIAVFTATAIGAQYAFSAVPFVEIVTLLFAVFSYVFGGGRGALSAVAFALLRQLLFGFFPVVLILYLIHFPLLSLTCGALRKAKLSGGKLLAVAVILAVVCTIGFTLLDNLLTPVYYGYSARAASAYFKASLPFMLGQSVCVAVTVGVLFLPLTKAIRKAFQKA